MKKKDLQLVRKKGSPDLYNLLRSKKEELALSYARLKAGKIKNTSLLRVLRKDIAQILTLIREKEIAQKVSDSED